MGLGNAHGLETKIRGALVLADHRVRFDRIRSHHVCLSRPNRGQVLGNLLEQRAAQINRVTF
jgi:hypothetical protein